MTTPLRLLAPIAALLFLAPAALAQTYSIPWYTIDGGGGTSTGSSFSIAGTAGQHDAGPTAGAMTGGGFTLTGGFWAGADAAPPCPADFNHDGTVNSQDYFDFLTAFFNGC
jgi:hypothetical protein